ncbi:Na(+)/H(+) antiporter subunit D [Salinisphaera hydrothermalis]|uniref:Monovalent cation/H+ antiporter subunit D n=1 Tax=Salinisphaera hydrothermalis (strain C41B8) TaxID=1304275 RepID=A0A084INV3_SALHC|nr:Na(+)/H(+) antiporter subunit D [Salinisphaera hydrothermalis]KEZ78387.1 monovalent cation/H+ antiporter subunit D [Salinisphaera hydrothermalis C41B8]
MSEWLGHAIASPALLLMAAGLVLAVTPRLVHAIWLLAVPVLALALLWALPTGLHGQVSLFGFDLTTLRVDGLSRIWATIFIIGSFLTGLYALHVDDRVQHVASLVYAGAAVGAVLAGDLVTLFIFWEATAISSVFLIWARRTVRAHIVGLRYLVIQVISGLLLMVGTIIHYHQTGSIAFDHLGLNVAGGWLIFLAFGIKAAFPLLHNWVQDAYPESTPTGTVVLSIYTTKLAIYSLARGYAGTELLITIGAVMTLFPIFYAVIENDLRRVLAYSLNNQLGFMVVGIGIGTPLALNGAAAHAFAHILYKGLLFMSMGAVLYRVGTVKASELGGLYKSMPFTTVFCIVGSMSISAFPLFSGFVTKSMILAAAADSHHWIAWCVLLVASAGVLDHSGIKVPFFSFFAHDAGYRVKEAPLNMLAAMAITAALCIGIGVYPAPLYAILPFDVPYSPYTTAHVVNQLQLLLFAALAFVVLFRSGLYPPEVRGLNIDSDWIYRRALPFTVSAVRWALMRARDAAIGVLTIGLGGARRRIEASFGARGVMARTWTTGVMLLWVTALLAAYLWLYY